jgi:hypothetical protein
MSIKQADVERILHAAINPITSTQITKALTGQRLVLEDDDKKVRRHLSKLLNYNILAATGRDEHGDMLYQYRFKMVKT